jgi:hypothetical protein
VSPGTFKVLGGGGGRKPTDYGKGAILGWEAVVTHKQPMGHLITEMGTEALEDMAAEGTEPVLKSRGGRRQDWAMSLHGVSHGV